jgi:hypothetical protein
MTALDDAQLRYQLETEMKIANQGYWTYTQTTFSRSNSPASIEKLKSFAGEKLLLALKQGFVVIVMHNEYALPRFEWAPYLNGRQ